MLLMFSLGLFCNINNKKIISELNKTPDIVIKGCNNLNEFNNNEISEKIIMERRNK
jgi:hypothetical protein